MTNLATVSHAALTAYIETARQLAILYDTVSGDDKHSASDLAEKVLGKIPEHKRTGAAIRIAQKLGLALSRSLFAEPQVRDIDDAKRFLRRLPFSEEEISTALQDFKIAIDQIATNQVSDRDNLSATEALSILETALGPRVFAALKVVLTQGVGNGTNQRAS